MDKTKRLVFIAAAILIVGALAYYYNDTKQIYGNDRESIVKVIHSIEGYEERRIEIVEIKDFKDQRIAGILADNNPGYIQFQKNKNGDYKWEHVQVNTNETFSTFIPELPLFMVVTNSDNIIAKMHVTVNEQLLEQEFIPYKASVAWIDLPKTDTSEYTFRDYKHYDKDGNIIELCCLQ